MSISRISYRKRRFWKYQLSKDYSIDLGSQHSAPVNSDYLNYLKLSGEGLLEIKAGYTWDGPSGIAIDTQNFMRASLVHDALYQLIRRGILLASNRKWADQLLWQMCLEDGMSTFRAWSVYRAVRMFGGQSIKPNLLSAP